MSLHAVVERLQSQIGGEPGVGDWFEVDQERIDAFAAATLDRQWIHTDPERAARESPFGATVAHGYLTLSLLPHLVASAGENRTEQDGVRLTVNYGLNRVRFPHPVVAGSRLRARLEMLSVEPVEGDALQLVRRVTVEIEGVEKPACVAETVSRLYLRPFPS